MCRESRGGADAATALERGVGAATGASGTGFFFRGAGFFSTFAASAAGSAGTFGAAGVGATGFAVIGFGVAGFAARLGFSGADFGEGFFSGDEGRFFSGIYLVVLIPTAQKL